MKKSKLIEMITREVDYQISELESHKMERESGEYIVYYQHWGYRMIYPDIHKKKAAFRGSVTAACQSFHEWWIKLWDEFRVNELPPDYQFFIGYKVPGMIYPDDYGTSIRVARGTGVMFTANPWRSMALAVPVQLERVIEDRIDYLFDSSNMESYDVMLSNTLQLPPDDIISVKVKTPQYVIDRFERAKERWQNRNPGSDLGDLDGDDWLFR